MDVFSAVLSILDSTIFAMLEVPVLAVFLVGSLMIAAIGVFILLRDAAKGRSRV